MSQASGIRKKNLSRASASPSKTSKIGSGAAASEPPVKRGLEKPKRGLEWTLPPFSICQKPKDSLNWDEIQNLLMRRQAPEEEDMQGIRLILRELKEKKIPIHDFINIISAYTSDNGEKLRSGLIEDLTAFQCMCQKIYHTMTQDVSDVLVNEQMQTVEFYQEKHDNNMEKMMQAINEIYEMAPTFNFETYYERRKKYLDFILPIPEPTTLDKDTEAMAQRQQLYHRLQWLRNEGDRMTEENDRLEKRLEKLKNQHENEKKKLAQTAAAEEAKAEALVKEERKMRTKLEQLNIDVEKTIISNEAETIKAFNEANMQPVPPPEKKKKRPKKKEDWISIVAEEIETENVQEVIALDKEVMPVDPNLRKIKMDAALLETKSRANVTSRQRSKIPFMPGFNAPEVPMLPSEVLQETRIEKSNITCQRPRSPCPEKGKQNRDWGKLR